MLILYSVLAVVCLVYIYSFIYNPRRKPIYQPVSAERSFKRGTGEEIPCIAPSTGVKLGTRRAYTRDEVSKVTQLARTAQAEWVKKADFAERKATVQDVLDWILNNQDQVIEWSVNDSGKTSTEAQLGEVMATCEKLRWLIAHAPSYLKREYRSAPALLAFTKQAYTEWHPFGCIGIIVPWNYPFQNVVAHAMTAIMTGNAAVIKVSEFASFSAEPIESMIREILAKRGHNPDLVQVVTGYRETGEALVDNADKILFIGSPAVGKAVMKRASDRLTPVILELGGKDPFIVFDDIDLEYVSDFALRGAFINCGQNCVSSERFYIQENVYDKFVDLLASKLNKLKCGHGSRNCNKSTHVDFGAITMAPQMKIVQSLIEDAISEKRPANERAKIVVGGSQYTDPNASNGRFFSPTLLRDVTHNHKIANEETFGPVMTCIKFKSEADVIKMANCTEYGLGSSVFTSDLKRAERMAGQLYTGMVNVNDFGMVPMVGTLPFGGVKASGFGCFGGPEGLRGFCRQVSVVTDRFPMRTTTPPFLMYPMWDSTIDIMQNAVRMVFSQDWLSSISGCISMMSIAMKGNKSN